MLEILGWIKVVPNVPLNFRNFWWNTCAVVSRNYAPPSCISPPALLAQVPHTVHVNSKLNNFNFCVIF